MLYVSSCCASCLRVLYFIQHSANLLFLVILSVIAIPSGKSQLATNQRMFPTAPAAPCRRAAGALARGEYRPAVGQPAGGALLHRYGARKRNPSRAWGRGRAARRRADFHRRGAAATRRRLRRRLPRRKRGLARHQRVARRPDAPLPAPGPLLPQGAHARRPDRAGRRRRDAIGHLLLAVGGANAGQRAADARHPGAVVPGQPLGRRRPRPLHHRHRAGAAPGATDRGAALGRVAPGQRGALRVPGRAPRRHRGGARQRGRGLGDGSPLPPYPRPDGAPAGRAWPAT